jgi:hypothetical protein
LFDESPLLAVAGVALLRWACAILDNIWTYNDGGTFTYILYALIPGLTAAVCIYLAVRGPKALKSR